MIDELTNSAKRNNLHNYVLLSLKANMELKYDSIKASFEYNPTFFGGKPTYHISTWNSKDISMIINDIINNSKYKLISVSEDNDYIRYHFLS